MEYDSALWRCQLQRAINGTYVWSNLRVTPIMHVYLVSPSENRIPISYLEEIKPLDQRVVRSNPSHCCRNYESWMDETIESVGNW